MASVEVVAAGHLTSGAGTKGDLDSDCTLLVSNCAVAPLLLELNQPFLAELLGTLT